MVCQFAQRASLNVLTATFKAPNREYVGLNLTLDPILSFARYGAESEENTGGSKETQDEAQCNPLSDC